MVRIITASKTISIDIIQHANVKIYNVVCPSSVEANESFVINYTVTNEGANDTCYGLIKDIDTNADIANSTWLVPLVNAESKICSVTIDGKDTPYYLSIEVGYQKAD